MMMRNMQSDSSKRIEAHVTQRMVISAVILLVIGCALIATLAILAAALASLS